MDLDLMDLDLMNLDLMDLDLMDLDLMNTALITGGTGKTGRRVVERLTAMGHPTRVGSRTLHPRFDWSDRSTWEPVLAGCASAYLAFQPDLAVPGAAETVGAFAGTAVAAGTTRLVLLSGRGEDETRKAEEALQASGADWTVVRSAFFAQNFSESFFVESLVAGELAMVGDGVGEPFVDADDIAEIVTAALTGDGHSDRLYEVTGPRLVTFAEAVETIGAATGRTIAYRETGPEEFAAGLAAAGLPREDARGMADLFAGLLDGRNARTADGVRQALGREPGDFIAYVTRSAQTGVWDA